MTRGVTFWNDETIRLIRDHFVAASVPTWLCRADSPEGERIVFLLDFERLPV